MYKALKPFELGTFELSHLAKETILSTASTPDHNTVKHELIAVFSNNTLNECEAPPDANREDRINFNTGYDVLHVSSHVPQVQHVDMPMIPKYPVFNVDYTNKFSELEKKIFDLKKLEGPTHSTEREHHYTEIDEKMDQLNSNVAGNEILELLEELSPSSNDIEDSNNDKIEDDTDTSGIKGILSVVDPKDTATKSSETSDSQKDYSIACTSEENFIETVNEDIVHNLCLDTNCQTEKFKISSNSIHAEPEKEKSNIISSPTNDNSNLILSFLFSIKVR